MDNNLQVIKGTLKAACLSGWVAVREDKISLVLEGEPGTSLPLLCATQKIELLVMKPVDVQFEEMLSPAEQKRMKAEYEYISALVQ